MIAVGERLPDATFFVMTEDGPGQRTTADVFSGRKVALFAVPGAFTPTCTNQHLPGFIANRAAFVERGIDAVACIAVNDVFVLSAWAKHSGAGEGIEFLSDGSAEFTRAAGLNVDMSPRGLGTRSTRYAMLVDDGVVRALLVEDVPRVAENSSAESLLRTIDELG